MNNDQPHESQEARIAREHHEEAAFPTGAVSPTVKSGSVREAAEKAARGILVGVHIADEDIPAMTTIIANAFAGFVPREEVEVAKKSTQFFADKCSAASIERENMSRQLVAAQAQNAHLQADNAALREKAEAVCIAWDAQDSTAKMELVCDDAVHALFNLLASPSTRPP